MSVLAMEMTKKQEAEYDSIFGTILDNSHFIQMYGKFSLNTLNFGSDIKQTDFDNGNPKIVTKKIYDFLIKNEVILKAERKDIFMLDDGSLGIVPKTTTPEIRLIAQVIDELPDCVKAK